MAKPLIYYIYFCILKRFAFIICNHILLLLSYALLSLCCPVLPTPIFCFHGILDTCVFMYMWLHICECPWISSYAKIQILRICNCSTFYGLPFTFTMIRMTKLRTWIGPETMRKLKVLYGKMFGIQTNDMFWR